MSLVRTEALVLQSREFSETSKIISFFSKERGRVSVLVKGGRKGQKKFPGGLETLNRVDLQYYYRGGRELQNFKSSDLIESYSNLRNDLKRTYTAMSLAETALRGTAPEDANASLYDNLTEALDALEATDSNPWTIRWAVLLRICRSLGFGIALEGCRRCGRKGPMRGFDFESGGFVCQTCYSKNAEPYNVSGEIWGVLRFLNHCPLDVAPRMVVKPETGVRIESLFLQYFKYHIPGLKELISWKTLPDIYWGTHNPNPSTAGRKS